MMLVEAIQASLREGGAAEHAPPGAQASLREGGPALPAPPGVPASLREGGAAAGAASANVAVAALGVGPGPGHAAPGGAEARGALPAPDPSPGPGAEGAHPGRRRASGGLLSLFKPRAGARRGALAEQPDPAAGELEAAARSLPAEQNAAREMLHPAPLPDGLEERLREAAAAAPAPPDCAASPADSPLAAGRAASAGSDRLPAGGERDGAELPVVGAGPSIQDVRIRAAAARAARAWQPPDGSAEYEAALPACSADANAARAPGSEAPEPAKPPGELGLAAAARPGAGAGCGCTPKGGRAVPILAAAGGDGGGAAAVVVKPPPQTPRGAMDYSALASGRWDEPPC